MGIVLLDLPVSVYPLAAGAKRDGSILPGAMGQPEQVPLEPVRRNRPTGDLAGLLGAVDVEARGAALGADETAERHVDQLTAAERRAPRVGVERLEDVIVE